ncbi:hypothetical protein [uncultured Lactobacillus sp.]|uniref:hypothetical protein n=1 Tax=uncultured Lactobacillus sp. TaxID=153152 RepID=UPI002622C465|nr:hypothetical protein [uncultured Lactobacillus sp.]
MNISTITALISAIIAICALASPVLTAWLNNNFALRKQKQDLEFKSKQMQESELTQQYEKQIDIISDFIYSINAAAITLNENDKKSTAKAGAKLLVLLNPSDQKIVIDAIKIVNDSNAGFSGNDVDQVRELADKITRKAPIWLEQANKNRLK